MNARSKPPGPKYLLPGANLLSFRRDPLNHFMRMAQEYGDFVRFSSGGQEMFLLNDPEMIQAVLVRDHRNFTKGRGLQLAKHLLGEGLLTSEGEFHRRQRRLAQPAFHRQRIMAYAEIMAQYSARAGARWKEGETQDILEEMMRLTLAIVGKTLFDADVESEAAEIGVALTETMALFGFMNLPFAERLLRLPLPPVRRFEHGRARLDKTIYRLIAEHRAEKNDQGDLISMLMLAQDEEGDHSGMTDKQLRDEAITLFLAGHETTANALTWTWYLLSQHPEAEARFHQEIDMVLGGRLPGFDDVAKLPYTRMVVAEALRLYPPAWLLGRRAIADYSFGDYCIPARSICVISQWVTQRDPRWFPAPERFDPERFTPEAIAERPKFTYFPFSSGPRVCIGEQFAWMEAILALATLGQQWQPRLAPGYQVATLPRITLRPRGGMPMTLKRRA